jgi:hypothetical protein
VTASAVSAFRRLRFGSRIFAASDVDCSLVFWAFGCLASAGTASDASAVLDEKFA